MSEVQCEIPSLLSKYLYKFLQVVGLSKRSVGGQGLTSSIGNAFGSLSELGVLKRS